jgi:glutathione S-transferase
MEFGAMIKIWGRQSAYNVQKALWAADELGLAYERIEAGGAAGGLDTQEFLTLNPNGTVPVLQDGKEVLWESQAIVRYLAAQYGRGTLWSAEPMERAKADQWMDWAQSGLQPAFMRLFWGFYRTPKPERNQVENQRDLADCIRVLKILDRHLETQSFLGGDTFTMGDIPAGTALYRMFEMGVDVPPLPHVEAWYARLKQRQAFKDNIMQPFDDLKGRLSF